MLSGLVILTGILPSPTISSMKVVMSSMIPSQITHGEIFDEFGNTASDKQLH